MGYVDRELLAHQSYGLQLVEAELGRMLDEYRNDLRPMPTYSELARLLHAQE